MKMEIKHLAPYLPYNLKVSSLHTLNAETGIGNINHIVRAVNEGKKQYRPILRPLSDLSNNEWYDIFVSDDIDDIWNKWHSDNSLDCIEYYLVTILIENHFDIFGLIEKGLAIDINNLKP